jgi:pimeloyl-ACP methyl ester carboxylesterase
MIIDLSWTDRSISAMAEDYVKAILEAQPDGPYSLLGWSLGGTLVIEMTNLLRRQGKQVDLLALVDPFVPPTVQGAVSAGSLDAAMLRYLNLHDALSADETARIIAIAKHLRRLSLRATLRAIDVRPYCWWSSDHAPADIAALEEAIGQQALGSCLLSSDHLAIPGDPAFLQSISELLAPRTEHTYAAASGTYGVSRAS